MRFEDRRHPDVAFDAVLHLLDRQVIDKDGLHVCKVDDLELSFYADGRPPAVTRILAGSAAFLPRLSGRTGRLLRRRWISLGVQYADRDVPLSLPLDVIDSIGSGVVLTVTRDGLLDRQPEAPEGVELHRMGELDRMTVRSADPRLGGKVLDVRLRAVGSRFELTHLVIGRGWPGALLGYDRGDFNGPWMVRSIVELIHRHVWLVELGDVEEIDWRSGVVRLKDSATAVPASLG